MDPIVILTKVRLHWPPARKGARHARMLTCAGLTGWRGKMERDPCGYISTGGRHGTLCIGVTSEPMKRLHAHRGGSVAGFTARHGVRRLVHFEMFADMVSATARKLKAWRRDWKP